jgi:hypothetical protein
VGQGPASSVGVRGGSGEEAEGQGNEECVFLAFLIAVAMAAGSASRDCPHRVNRGNDSTDCLVTAGRKVGAGLGGLLEGDDVRFPSSLQSLTVTSSVYSPFTPLTCLSTCVGGTRCGWLGC